MSGSNPEGPQLFECGGSGQPACPPRPAIDPNWKTPFYTYADMLMHGHEQYHKGRSDQEAEVKQTKA